MGELFSNALTITKKNALILIGALLSVVVLSMIVNFIISAFLSIPIVGSILNILSVVFQLYIGVAFVKLGLTLIDGKEPEFSDVKPSWEEILRYLISGLMLFIIFLMVFMLTIGALGMFGVLKPGLSALYIDVFTTPANLVNYSNSEKLYAVAVLFLMAIPAILLYLRLQFSNYLVIDKKTNAAQAIFTSYRMTKGYLFYIVLVLLGVFLLNILGLIVFFVGLLFTIPMSFIVMLLLYRSLEQNLVREDFEQMKDLQ